MRPIESKLLIELEFDATFRPSDMSTSDDHRVLAVGLVKITVFCLTTQDRIGEFDFMEASSNGFSLLYGFSRVESWGRWSSGPNAAVVLGLSKRPRGEIRIEFTHIVANRVLPVVPGCVRIAGGEPRAVEFRGGVLALTVDPSPPIPGALVSYDASDCGDDIELSIIISNSDRPDLTFACVTAILSAAIDMRFEIIVVDYGGESAATTRLAEMDLPVRMIALAKPRSFGCANNIAAEAARGARILFLHNDAFLEKGVSEKLAAELSNGEIGIVGPSFRYPDGSLQELGGFVSVEGETSTPVWTGVGWDAPSAVDADYVSAACLMLRRVDFLSIGGFDSEFDIDYLMDVDLCLRMRAIGKRVRHVATVTVRHVPGGVAATPDAVAKRDNARRRNLHLLRARWGLWLITRNRADAPIVERLDVQELQKQISQFPGEVLNCVVSSDQSASDASRSSLAVAAAASVLRPTAIVARVPCPVVDIRQKAGAFGQYHDRLTGGCLADMAERDIDVTIVSGIEFPAVPPPFGRLRILHCPFPAASPSREEASRRIGSLLNFDAVATDSEFGRRALAQAIEALGAPAIDIDVITPAINLFPVEQSPEARSNIILCLGALRAGPSGGGHRAVLRALRFVAATAKSRRWRLVVVGELLPSDDASYVDMLRRWPWPIDVDVMADPPHATLRRLFAHAKICVSPHGLGAQSPAEAHFCTHSSTQIGAAISAGCIPVVFGVGAEAEFCETHDVGFRFNDEHELVTALEQAIELANGVGVTKAQRDRMRAYSQTAHADAWAQLIARLDAGAEREERAAPSLRSERGLSPPALIVAGCHRSGTSAMARMLSIAGVDLPSDLMIKKADNPTGFWEAHVIADWNEALLRSARSGWDDPFAFFSQPCAAQIAPGLIDEAAARITGLYPGNRPIVVKDPRISLLAPLWDRALRKSRYAPNFIIMVRNPLEVAASLTARNKFSLGRGLSIWASYMLTIERDTRDTPRVFVAYRDLLANPESVLDRIRSQLGIPLPRYECASGSISRFVDPALCQHHFNGLWNKHLSEAVHEYFVLLQAACHDQPLPNTAGSALEAWLAELRDLLSTPERTIST